MSRDPRVRLLGCAAWLGAALLVVAAPGRAEPIRLADQVPLSEAHGVTDAVRTQCGIQTALPELVAAASSDVELVQGHPKGGRVLVLAVEEVHAPGGGPFAGPKWMVVSAELREGGRLVGSARAKRVTAAPFGGTCGQLRKVAEAIAVDLGAWLRDPRSGARLGDQ
jgi:hypothetical protein